MQIIPDEVDPVVVYSTMIRAITPRPIAWVSTISTDGITNLAPFSYFNGVCSKPAALMFSPVNHADGSEKDTIRNIRSIGQFVVNMVPHSLGRQMFTTSQPFEFGESEFDAAELTASPAVSVQPPRVAESPIHFECELLQLVPVGNGPFAANVVIGKILLIHVEDRVLNSAGKIDPVLVDSIGRLGGREYCRTKDRFEIV